MTEDYMVGWHHHLDEHEFEQAPGVGDGQEGLACCQLCMRWPKYWSFSFSIIPSKEIPGLISLRMDWLSTTEGRNPSEEME